jgi:hypothetical protein
MRKPKFFLLVNLLGFAAMKIIWNPRLISVQTTEPPPAGA